MAKECSHFLEQVEQGCSTVQAHLSTLQIYEERLGGEFSTQHFQALKAKACAVGSGVPGVMRVWNAAWVQCQEVKKRLEETQKQKKCSDKKQIQPTTSADYQRNAGGMENRREKGEEVEGGGCSSARQHASNKDPAHVSDCIKETTTGVCVSQHLKPDLKESKALNSSETPGKITPVFPQNGTCHPETRWRPRERHSEVDLRTVASVQGERFPSHKTLGRSLSEGSYVSSHFNCGFSPLVVRNKHCENRTRRLEPNLQPGQKVPFPQNQSLHSGHVKLESRRSSNAEEGGPSEGCAVSTHSPKDLRTPETLLTQTENNGSNVL